MPTLALVPDASAAEAATSGSARRAACVQALRRVLGSELSNDEILAEVLLLMEQLARPQPARPTLPEPVREIYAALAPRVRATLHHLLDGASHKQVADRMQISYHTVQHYVKQLHRSFHVSSNGALCALLRPLERQTFL